MNALPKRLLLLLAGLGLLAGCKKDLDTYYTPQNAPGFFNIGILGTTFNTTFATKYGPGKSIPITVAYNQTDNPATVTVFQATKTDSMQVGSYPVSGSFNQTFQTTTQTIPYVVPTTYALNTAVRLDITMTFADGAQRRRRINYTIAN
ncbi:hypothetical protein FNT36_07955 [Hymenobacter setariae]|uniref:DUF1735 domain-containing protein n=1 Tax=Hymenobacter setariae TaxID=2594794 RepID=A0A558BXX7_9BACT|nr:hypothetical protein [Hymenobacter setariae]TVT41374.1 hypothetical protein FNT36_07955 [Hymenobacter setariae]